jgi:LAO/AO transport system kinase
MPLADEVLAGSRRATARAITRIESAEPGTDALLAALFPSTGRAHLIGVTGAPGTGKSSLVNQLALELRRREKTVAIVAVDPTSPFSGGAILGDRIRMRDLHGDTGVFIRSMATRGSLGGLARATADVVKVLDAAGFDIILIETVGAGQSEVDIARHAHTVLVVEAPGMGDDVQAIKAGILEIADILVVNKADDQRTPNTVRALRAALDLSHPGEPRLEMHYGTLMQMIAAPEPGGTSEGVGAAWEVQVLTTKALAGEGVPALVDSINQHRDYLNTSGEMGRRERARLVAELESTLREALMQRLLASVQRGDMATLVERVVQREVTPQSAVDSLLQQAAPDLPLARSEEKKPI